MSVPELIGRYEVKAELGHGGMATVYHAYDPRFKRDVAIKVLPREYMHDENFHARFRREAETIAALDHPAIVLVYDFGEQEGQPYLVMRYMAGGSLADKVNKGALSLEEAVRVIARIAPALDEAHSRGIIHRDLKPANILFDQRNDPFLSDFGIVRISEGTSHITGSGIVGTPAYMAPEMIEPTGLTPLVDIYALGVTFYQMLTGAVPFEADTPMGVLMAHLNKPAPDIRDSRPDLPEDVHYVVVKALAKRPEERYQSAAAMVADLQSALGSGIDEKTVIHGEPLETMAHVTPPSAPAQTLAAEKMRRQAGRQGGPPAWLWIVGGIVGLGILLGGLAVGGVLTFGAGTQSPTETPAAASTTTEPLQPTEPPTAGPSPLPTDTPPPTSTPLPTPVLIDLANVGQLAALRTIDTGGESLTSIAWSPDGTRIVSGATSGLVQTWDAASGQVLLTLDWHTAAVNSVDWSPDGRTLVSGSDDMTAMLWDADEEAPPTIMEGQHDEPINTVAFSPDGARVATASYDRKVNIWGAGAGTHQITNFAPRANMTIGASWAPDSVRIVTGTDGTVGGAILIWDAIYGSLVRSMYGHAANVTAVDWSPVSELIVSGAEDGEVIVWDGHTGDLMRTMRGHAEPISSVAWSPDGTMIASATVGGQVFIWNWDPIQHVATLGGDATFIAWSPDGRMLAGIDGNQIVIWQIPPGP